MDAVTLITQNLDVEKLLNHYDFEQIKSDGDIIRACCKLHGGNNPTAFVINRNTGYWYCHTSDCGGGDAFTLVERFEGYTREDFGYKTVPWLASFYNINIDGLQIIDRKTNYLDELKKFINIAKKHKKKDLQEFYLQEEIHEVVKFRNFQLETLQHFKLGHVESVSLFKRNGETYTLYNRLVFPIVFDNKQVGVSLRRVKSSDFPKWSHQPVYLKTNAILYNYDDVKSSQSIVICEGITDVWAFYEIGIPAVAIFGSHITNEQYRLLMLTSADLIFAFDGDEAGQTATKKAIEMFHNKANISVISFDITEDPCSISREELYEKYEHRKKC